MADPTKFQSEWTFHTARIQELENSKRYLEEELTATKRALLHKEDKIEELLSLNAHLEGKLRIESKNSKNNREDVLKALSLIKDAFDVGDHKEFELWWLCTFAFVGEAIRHENIVKDLAHRHNEAVLAYNAEKKLRSEAAAQLSGLHDTIDSLTFELNRVKRDHADVVARSQRQADRVTQLESAGDLALKAQDIILEARNVLGRWK